MHSPQTQLHPAHFSLHPTLYNILIIIGTKISHVIGPKFGPKNSKLTILTENWHSWYPGVADSGSGPRFLKSWPQNSFIGKFALKKSKLSILHENWHTWYFGRTDSKCGVRFPKFRPQNSFCSSLGQKNISCLFLFETLLLFLDIQLVLVLSCFTLFCLILQAVLKARSAYILFLSWIFFLSLCLSLI